MSRKYTAENPKRIAEMTHEDWVAYIQHRCRFEPTGRKAPIIEPDPDSNGSWGNVIKAIERE